ncbi:translation initiation factor IF-2-like [Phocoena sinus]|uniref:translation initiation factor IF-2-like n=1 Tax=Phocoena sinus TaxID=42100 RepID=UPI0013C4A265|nr:translation initiation factor IF-2-like [Phocoena sinus]
MATQNSTFRLNVKVAYRRPHTFQVLRQDLPPRTSPRPREPVRVRRRLHARNRPGSRPDATPRGTARARPTAPSPPCGRRPTARGSERGRGAAERAGPAPPPQALTSPGLSPADCGQQRRRPGPGARGGREAEGSGRRAAEAGLSPPQTGFPDAAPRRPGPRPRTHGGAQGLTPPGPSPLPAGRPPRPPPRRSRPAGRRRRGTSAAGSPGRRGEGAGSRARTQPPTRLRRRSPGGRPLRFLAQRRHDCRARPSFPQLLLPPPSSSSSSSRRGAPGAGLSWSRSRGAEPAAPRPPLGPRRRRASALGGGPVGAGVGACGAGPEAPRGRGAGPQLESESWHLPARRAPPAPTGPAACPVLPLPLQPPRLGGRADAERKMSSALGRRPCPCPCGRAAASTRPRSAHLAR